MSEMDKLGSVVQDLYLIPAGVTGISMVYYIGGRDQKMYTLPVLSLQSC